MDYNPGEIEEMGLHLEPEQEQQDRRVIDGIQSSRFDPRTLNDTVATRAVWMLVKSGKWEELYELGIDRATFEPRIRRYAHYSDRPTSHQVWYLRHQLPELVDASERLRELYLFKMFIRGEL